MGWNLNLTFHGIGFMAYQQKFNPDWQIGLRATHKYAVVCISALWCSVGMIDFSWKITIPVSFLKLEGGTRMESYLPLSKIILIHNLLQMSYWLSEASLTLSTWELFAHSLGFQHLEPKKHRLEEQCRSTNWLSLLHCFTCVVGIIHRINSLLSSWS